MGDRGYRGRGGGYGGGNAPSHHGGGGGQYQGGARQQQQPQQEYQRSFVGNKHDRDERDPYLELVDRLMRLCDRTAGAVDDAEKLEGEMQSAVALCKTALNHRMDAKLKSLLLDCMVQLATKTPVYAVLIGLLNDEAPEFIGELTETLNDAFNAALAAGERDRARLLLRAFCALVLTNVLHASGVVALLEALLETALAAVNSGRDASGETWQAWADYLVYIVAMALPWGGSELPDSAPAEVARLFEGMATYLAKRPIAADDDLRPFNGALSEDDTAAKSDSGGASFLPTLVAALQECRQANDWHVTAIPALHTPFQTRLASARTHELPHIQIPQSPPGLDPQLSRVQASAFLRVAYPPRGGIRLLERRHTEADRPAIERLVAEEYFHDVIVAWDGEKAECVRRLGAGLPIPWAYVNLMAEFLFGQLLSLPAPRLPLPAYDLLLIELCKLPAERFPFAKALSACARELFARMQHLDPELRSRLATWLSSHLSHFGFHWPWERWQHVLQAPPADPQRQFCTHVIERLVRLAYWDKIHASLPEGFHELLGARPRMPVLPGQAQPAAVAAAPAPAVLAIAAAPTEADPAGGPEDEAMRDAAGGAAAEPNADSSGPDAGPSAESGGAPVAASASTAQAAAPEKADPESVLAGQLLSALRTAAPASEGGGTAWMSGRELLEWLTEVGPPEWAEEPVGALRVVMRALLAVGSKSPTHLHAAFQRYEEPLRALLAGCGDNGGVALLSLAADFYSSLPQKLLMVADRLLALHLIGGDAVVQWAFGSDALRQPSDVCMNRVAWDIVHFAVDRTVQLPAQGEEEARAKAEEVEACRDKARCFADKSSMMADARNQQGVVDASAAEEKMLAAASALQAELDQQLLALEVLREEPTKVLLQAFGCFAQFLVHHTAAAAAAAASSSAMQVEGEDAAQGDDDATAKAGDATARAAAAAEAEANEQYARLRSFARRYRIPALPLAERLEAEVFAAGQVPDRARVIMHLVMHW